MERLLIKTIENGIRAVKLGSKRPADIEGLVNTSITRLNGINDGMAKDLGDRWNKVLNHYNEKIQ